MSGRQLEEQLGQHEGLKVLDFLNRPPAKSNKKFHYYYTISSPHASSV